MKDYRCQSPMCPLPGSMSHSIGNDAVYYCRHHWKADKADHQMITEDLRANPPERLRPWQDLCFTDNSYVSKTTYTPKENPVKAQIDKVKETLKNRMV